MSQNDNQKEREAIGFKMEMLQVHYWVVNWYNRINFSLSCCTNNFKNHYHNEYYLSKLKFETRLED